MIVSIAASGKKRFPDKIFTYKRIGNVTLKAHVFYPPNHEKTDSRPVVAFFFGGGWVTGTPRQFYQQSRYLSELGMIAISFEYRIEKKHGTSPFECVKDGKSAIRWIRRNAPKLGVDPRRVVAAGGSTGGHVAACTGVVSGCEEDGEDTTISSVPNLMALFNPVIDTTEEGYGSAKVKGREILLSPRHHVKKGIAPTIVFYGDADTTVPIENVKRFAKAMMQAGNVCKLVVAHGATHGFFNGSWFRNCGDENFNEIMRSMIEFLVDYKIMKKKDWI